MLSIFLLSSLLSLLFRGSFAVLLPRPRYAFAHLWPILDRSFLSRRIILLSFSFSLAPQLLFILISSAFLLFDGFGTSMKRRKYEIIMIIMSHFARNNMVEALARFVGLITSDAIACHPRIRLSGSSPFRIYPIFLPPLSLAFPSLLPPPPSSSSNPTLHPAKSRQRKCSQRKPRRARERRRRGRKNWVNEALITARF